MDITNLDPLISLGLLWVAFSYIQPVIYIVNPYWNTLFGEPTDIYSLSYTGSKI